MISRVMIGCDAGLANFGYSVVDFPARRPVIIAAGSWKTEPEFPVDDRIDDLMARLWSLLELHTPLGVAYEAYQYFGAQSASWNMSILSRVTEATRQTCRMRDTRCVSVTTTQAKRAIGLIGRTEKQQVRRMIDNMCDGMRCPNQHAVDATAVAIAGRALLLRKGRAA